VTVTTLTDAVTTPPATLTVSYSSTNTINATPVTLTITP